MDNYNTYVNILSKRNESSLMPLSFWGYAIMTFVVMLNVCLLIYWEKITTSWVIIFPISFVSLIIIFAIWRIKLKRTVSTSNEILLYNGVIALANSCMYFAGYWIIFYFGELSFSVVHASVHIIFTTLLIISSCYLFYSCKNGKKKKYTQASLSFAVVLGVVGANIARHFAKNIMPEGNEITVITIVILVFGFLELFCSILELSRYYVAHKYNLVLQ